MASPQAEAASPTWAMRLTYNVASQLGGSLLEMRHYPLAHAAPWSPGGEKPNLVTMGAGPCASPFLPSGPPLPANMSQPPGTHRNWRQRHWPPKSLHSWNRTEPSSDNTHGRDEANVTQLEESKALNHWELTGSSRGIQGTRTGARRTPASCTAKSLPSPPSQGLQRNLDQISLEKCATTDTMTFGTSVPLLLH